MLEVIKNLPPLTLLIAFSGQDKIRPLWRYYFQNTNGIVFVIDSSDAARISIARTELSFLLASEELRGVPLLILANKQDLPGAMSPSKIEEELYLKTSCRGEKRRDYRVMGCCAVAADGIDEGITWLGERIREFKRKT